MLRGMMSKSLRDLAIKLTHAEFTCNGSPSYATSHSLIEVCYILKPHTPIDLIPIP